MINNYFEVLRPGINTTFQDLGRKNLYHIGIPFSGAMDNRNYLISNKLVENTLSSPVLEFAYQGPLLKYHGEKLNFAITGDVNFKLKSDQDIIDGICYESYIIKDGDEIDILSTNKSVYGYFSISAEFNIKFQWGSCSVNTKANIGSNNGKKISVGQEIQISNIHLNQFKKKINYHNIKIDKIRIIKGTNFDFFSDKGKEIIFNKEFIVSVSYTHLTLPTTNSV